MGSDYIPPTDADFHNWFGNLNDYANANAADLGLTPDQTLALTNAYTVWKTAFPAHTAAEAAFHAAKTNKDGARAAAESVTSQVE